MPEHYFPFDAGAGSSITEDQWSKMARLWRTDGVIRGRDNQLAVTANGSGMQVFVDLGVAWLRGYYYDTDASITVPIDAPDTQDRIDRVVLRLDTTGNTVAVHVNRGTPGTTPAVPPLLAGPVLFDLPLAQVRVNVGDVVVASGRVTDERLYSALDPLLVGQVNPQPASPGVTVQKGTSQRAAAEDHRHANDGYSGSTKPANPGDSMDGGSAATVSHGDHGHALPAWSTSPNSSAPGDAAAAGSSTTLARGDHKHARESFSGSTKTANFGDTMDGGTATTVSRGDHGHAMPTHTKADHDALDIDADTLDGHDSTYFATATDLTTHEAASEPHANQRIWHDSGAHVLLELKDSTGIAALGDGYGSLRLLWQKPSFGLVNSVIQVGPAGSGPGGTGYALYVT